MNKYFIKKISDLKTNNNIDENEALEQLNNFISTKTLPAEGFQLREISKEKTLEIIKLLKGKKSLGSDWICGYSLKLEVGWRNSCFWNSMLSESLY